MPNTPNYFVGDIITAMRFYYKDTNGNEVTTTSKSVSNDLTPLDAIIASTEIKDDTVDVLFEDDISCDITYYIGATLVRKSEDKPFELVTETHNVWNPPMQYAVLLLYPYGYVALSDTTISYLFKFAVSTK